MKKMYQVLCLLWVMIGASPLYASSIATVDINKIVQKSVVWDGIKSDTQKHAQKIQRNVMVKQKKIEDTWSKIKELRKRDKIPEKLVELEQVLKKERSELQEYLQKRKRDMDKKFGSRLF